MKVTFDSWDRPSCDAISWLSFTSWSALQTCFLKTVFLRDQEFGEWNRGNPRSALGVARHQLIEFVNTKVADGSPSPSATWIKEQFDLLLRKQWHLLSTEWAPAAVPPIKQWQDVAYVRHRLVSELARKEDAEDDEEGWPSSVLSVVLDVVSGHLPQGPPPDPSRPATGCSKLEELVWDSANKLYGRIDRLENRDGRLVVTDYKTAVGQTRSDLVDAHSDQLLFYANLVASAFGEWPEIEIQSAASQVVSLDYSVKQAESLRDLILATRQEFNENLSSGDCWSLAEPSRGACAWCPFQVVCPAFIESASTFAADKDSLDRSLSVILGVVKETRIDDAGLVAILEQPFSLSLSEGAISVTRLPKNIAVSPGDVLVASQVEIDDSSRVARSRWNSPLRVIKQEGDP